LTLLLPVASTSGSPFFSVGCLVTDVLPCNIHAFYVSPGCVSPGGAWSTLQILIVYCIQYTIRICNVHNVRQLAESEARMTCDKCVPCTAQVMLMMP